MNVGTAINRNETVSVKSFSIKQNYPNPFNPSTSINFELPSQSIVKISVYNVLGQNVKDLMNNEMPAGKHSINFNAANLASGIYIYQIVAETLTGNMLYRTAKKMILLK